MKHRVRTAKNFEGRRVYWVEMKLLWFWQKLESSPCYEIAKAQKCARDADQAFQNIKTVSH